MHVHRDAVAPATHLVSTPPSSVHAAAKLLAAVTLTGGLLGLLAPVGLLLAEHACMLAGLVLCGLAVCMCADRALCVCFIGTGKWC